MIKLYIYPNAPNHGHDSTVEYINTVPLSKKGIEEHCELVPPDCAEYFYMGQVSDGMRTPAEHEFKYLKGNESRHICDIEGDWANREIPAWLKKCVLTINSAKDTYLKENMNFFVRPTFSYLLMDMINNKFCEKYDFIDNLSFGFNGYPDPNGTRLKLKDVCRIGKIKSDISFNDSWLAKNSAGSEKRKLYCDTMKNNTFALCPQGMGISTVRFFEACYFGRIPVVVSDCVIMGEEYFKDKPFYFKINPRVSNANLINYLRKIQSVPIKDLKKMSENAKIYFETYVRGYFKDPTLMFLNFLMKGKENGL
jgi:hypothetical protein